jgi:hypothetical protein
LLRRTTISIAQPPSKELTTWPPLSDSSQAPRPLRPSDHCSFASGAGVPRIRMSLVHLGDRGSDGGGAYSLLGSLTAASQLTPQMLAEMGRTSERLSKTRRRSSRS